MQMSVPCAKLLKKPQSKNMTLCRHERSQCKLKDALVPAEV